MKESSLNLISLIRSKVNVSKEELNQIIFLADKLHLQKYGRLINDYEFYEEFDEYEMREYKAYDYLSETDKECVFEVLSMLDDGISVECWKSLQNSLKLGFTKEFILKEFFFKCEEKCFTLDPKIVELSREIYFDE